MSIYIIYVYAHAWTHMIFMFDMSYSIQMYILIYIYMTHIHRIYMIQVQRDYFRCSCREVTQACTIGAAKKTKDMILLPITYNCDNINYLFNTRYYVESEKKKQKKTKTSRPKNVGNFKKYFVL